MSIFKAAMLQLNSQNDIARNLFVIETMLRDVKAKGASLACLPENAFFMRGNDDTIPDQSEAVRNCQQLAHDMQLSILIGSAHIKDEKSGKYYNRSFFMDKNGAILAEYDKIHLFDVTLGGGEHYRESDRMLAGEKAVLFSTELGKIGLTICYDVRFPQLYRTLAQAGAEILSIPAAFTYTTGKAHWHTLLKARAIETGCFVFAPAQCGIHPNNRQTYGHSLIISPWGEIVAEAREAETAVIYADIDLGKVAEARNMIPSLSNEQHFSL